MNRIISKFNILSISAIESLVPLVLSFFTLPFLFHKLGPEGFGYFSIFLSLAGFAPLLNFGLPQSFYRFVSERRQILNESSAYFVSFILLVCGVLFLVSVLIFFVSILLLPYLPPLNSLRSDIFLLSIYLALIFFFQETGSSFSFAIRAVEKFEIIISIECFFKVIYIIGIFFIGNFQDVIALHCMLLFLASLLKFLYLYKFVGVGINKRSFYLFRNIEIRTILSFGGWSWLQSFSGVLLSVFDRILVSIFFGVSSAGFYSAFLSFSQIFHFVLAGLFQPFYGRVLAASDARFEINKLFFFGVRILSVYLFLALIFLVFFGNYFITLWLGSQATSFISTFYVLVFSYVVLGLSVLPHYLLLGILDYKYISLVGIIAGVASMVASFFLSNLGIDFFSAGKLLFAVILLFHFFRLRVKVKEHLQNPPVLSPNLK